MGVITFATHCRYAVLKFWVNLLQATNVELGIIRTLMVEVTPSSISSFSHSPFLQDVNSNLTDL